MTSSVVSTAVNRKCDPPYYHDENCRCVEKEAEDADDYRETMLDRREGRR